MEKLGDTENNSTATGKVTGVLSENLRRQYLDVMGIQTWFDPALEIPETAKNFQVEENRSVTENISLPHSESSTETPSSEIVSSIDPIVDIPVVDYIEPQTNSINDIESLNTHISQCELCELHTSRKQAISGEGNIAAKLFIIIDAPVSEVKGDNALFEVSDKQMLKLMLQAIGFELSSVYFTSLVKCRPPEQRAPQTSEMICCDDHLSAQIKLIDPEVIMILGESASQQLLVSQKPLTDLRLRHHKHIGVPVYASYHPRELFNSSETKRKVWADLLQIRKHIK